MDGFGWLIGIWLFVNIAIVGNLGFALGDGGGFITALLMAAEAGIVSLCFRIINQRRAAKEQLERDQQALQQYKEKEQAAKEQLERNQQAFQQYKEYYTSVAEEITVLMDEYAKTSNHTAGETQMIWDRYNNLVQIWNINKENSVFPIYIGVLSNLNARVPHFLEESAKENLFAYNKMFAEKLLDFTTGLRLPMTSHPLNRNLCCDT
jgi:hypothetical protein